MCENRSNICVIAFPWASNVLYTFLSNLLKILEPLSDSITLIGGNTYRIETCSEKIKLRDIGIGMHYVKEIKPKFLSILLWILKCISVQIKTSLELFQLSKDVNVIIFYMAYPYYLLPLLIAKIFGYKTIEVITRSKSSSSTFINKIIRVQEKILLSLVDYISPESQSTISQLNLSSYRNKILPMGARFIPYSFTTKVGISGRKNMVGYIGRIKSEKGVMNFIEAIPKVTKELKNTEFIIGGEGDLLNEIKTMKELQHYHVTITGWIPQENFADYLNELKLLVLPTQHTEGLPTIILEAMACGTPVLTTQVGAISDIIKEGETGFIMDSNSPECIAKKIIKVLNCNYLERIAKNVQQLIEENYGYESAVERYRKIVCLETLSG